jgi:pyruvate dehydrogenase E2 component (dihydrolipoamide acetyltransferase)
LWVYQVEDPDDIQNVPATVADGSEVREEKSTTTDNVLEKNLVKTVTSELPPHVVLDMPALSPTMVRKIVYHFLLRLLC